MNKIIDAHIHLDHYQDQEIAQMIADLECAQCTDLIAVSFHLDSCRKNLQLAEKYQQVKPAFGFHPEQWLPSDQEMADLFIWMGENQEAMIAIGEVGLPYYLRMESEKTLQFSLEGYIELLDQFLQKAKEWDKPVILHAVYEDAPVVCGLLEKHSIEKAHFHWFKGDTLTTERMIANGYYISITPDVLYEEEIQSLVRRYPLAQMMVETDGPWPFTGEFAGRMTHPQMIHHSISMIAQLKEIELSLTYDLLYNNTNQFYGLK